MARVVTVTSIGLQRDSRTLRFAASIARLDHESIVVEGEPSSLLRGNLPFEVLSPPRLEAGEHEGGNKADTDDAGSEQRSVARIARRLPPRLRQSLGRIISPLLNIFALIRFSVRELLRSNIQTWRLLPDADVYWLHSFWQFPSVYLKARRRRAHFLYDTPDAYWEERLGPGRVAAGVRRAYEAIEKLCIRRAEHFTTVSDGVAGLLEERFGRRPDVVRNFHDLRLDVPAASDIRTATGVAPDDFLLVVVGNMKPELLVREGLLAMQQLPDHVHLAFVGRNHEPNRSATDELGLSGRVHLLGHVAPTQIASFIRTADASPILTRATTDNDRYALPNKFFHAVAAGLPILYPPMPEISALARRHQLGVEIDPADPASIAEGIRSLSGDPRTAERYRANVERARHTMSWENEEPMLAGFLPR